MRKVNLLGAALLALSTSAWSYGAVAQTAAPDNSATPSPPADSSAPAAPADDTAKKPAHHMHHHMAKMSHGTKGETKGDAAVDDLNAESLDAAKSGKTFTPPTATPVADKESGKSMKHTAKHAHHKAAKKAPASDTGTSGASDSSTTPPADNSGK